MSRLRRDIAPRPRILVGMILSIFLGSVVANATETTPRQELERAEDYFLVTDFDEALERVDALIRGGELYGTGLRKAYVLKARCEVARNRKSSGRSAFVDALGLDRGWRPDPDFFTNDEIVVFEEALAEVESRAPVEPLEGKKKDGGTPWYKQKKVLIPVAAAVIGSLFIMPPPPPPTTEKPLAMPPGPPGS